LKRLTSSQVLGTGFAAILGLLVFCAYEAARLQRAGGEPQGEAYRRFIQQDDAVTAVRRTVWLGGINARDYFLNRGAVGRERFSAQLAELERTGKAQLRVLREALPQRVKELKLERQFDEFIGELQRLEAPKTGGGPAPVEFIEEVLIPRRLELLGLFDDFRATVRQQLVEAQNRYDLERAAAARTLLWLLGVALCLGVLVAAVSLRYASRLDRERHRHFAAIALANQELEQLSARLLEIQEQERRSLSQELHDEVGQTLTALRMEISQALKQVPEAAMERLQKAYELADQTVGIVRDISLMLRPSLLDDLGLGPALDWQLERFSSRSGIRYTFIGADVGAELPDAVKTCVFRIAQEALNNCEKYAGAKNLRVILRHEADRVSLEVEDDGVGFRLDSRGLPLRGTGILGMKERAQNLGGGLQVESAPGEGTRVALMLPVQGRVEAGARYEKELV
jgi:signal transduction histidine kinase